MTDAILPPPSVAELHALVAAFASLPMSGKDDRLDGLIERARMLVARIEGRDA